MAYARTVILERVVEEFLEQERSTYPPLERVFRALEWRTAILDLPCVFILDICNACHARGWSWTSTGNLN